MSDKPRTWRITSDERFLSGGVTLVGDTEVHSGTKVIELEPMLDLLERHVRINRQSNLATSVDDASEALLCEHGRLK